MPYNHKLHYNPYSVHITYFIIRNILFQFKKALSEFLFCYYTYRKYNTVYFRTILNMQEYNGFIEEDFIYTKGTLKVINILQLAKIPALYRNWLISLNEEKKKIFALHKRKRGFERHLLQCINISLYQLMKQFFVKLYLSSLLEKILSEKNNILY